MYKHLFTNLPYSDWFEEYKKNLVSIDKRFNICENEYWSCF